jgi:hypothetical protein
MSTGAIIPREKDKQRYEAVLRISEALSTCDEPEHLATGTQTPGALGPFRGNYNAPSRSLVSPFPPSTAFQPALLHVQGQRQRTRSLFAKCLTERAGRSTMSPSVKCTCRRNDVSLTPWHDTSTRHGLVLLHPLSGFRGLQPFARNLASADIETIPDAIASSGPASARSL